MIKQKYKISHLWKIMQDITTMTSNAPLHKSAFRAAFQANLLKEHCDKPQHKILKDFLLALEMMKIVNESENEEGEMDEDSRDVEEGECLTTDYESDASAFSNASTSATKKKKAILMIEHWKAAGVQLFALILKMRGNLGA